VEGMRKGFVERGLIGRSLCRGLFYGLCRGSRLSFLLTINTWIIQALFTSYVGSSEVLVLVEVVAFSISDNFRVSLVLWSRLRFSMLIFFFITDISSHLLER
jgi:hypothetical protein